MPKKVTMRYVYRQIKGAEEHKRSIILPARWVRRVLSSLALLSSYDSKFMHPLDAYNAVRIRDEILNEENRYAAPEEPRRIHRAKAESSGN
jgi:hypothetical protein